MAQWYCKLMGDELGPFTSAQLLEMARSHKLTPDDYVRKGETGAWVGAYRVKGLFDEDASASGISKIMQNLPTEPAPATPPEPPKAVEDWYCICKGRKLGPMTFEVLQALAAEGQLSPHDRVWTNLMPKHHTAAEIQGLMRSAAS
jgi:hypothetical protein